MLVRCKTSSEKHSFAIFFQLLSCKQFLLYLGILMSHKPIFWFWAVRLMSPWALGNYDGYFKFFAYILYYRDLFYEENLLGYLHYKQPIGVE